MEMRPKVALNVKIFYVKSRVDAEYPAECYIGGVYSTIPANVKYAESMIEKDV